MTTPLRDIVVGFRDRRSSLAAVRFGLNEVRNGHFERLVVAHATSVPVAVDNGPAAALADSMGDPIWSQVHHLIEELGADPERTVTHGRPDHVLARSGRSAALVVLGRRRWHLPGRDTASMLRRLIDTPIVRVAASVPESVTTYARQTRHWAGIRPFEPFGVTK